MIRACSSTPALLISTQRCAENQVKGRRTSASRIGFHPAVKFLRNFKQQISADGALIEVGGKSRPPARALKSLDKTLSRIRSKQ
jgi:hypothetical protein